MLLNVDCFLSLGVYGCKDAALWNTRFELAFCR